MTEPQHTNTFAMNCNCGGVVWVRFFETSYYLQNLIETTHDYPRHLGKIGVGHYKQQTYYGDLDTADLIAEAVIDYLYAAVEDGANCGYADKVHWEVW